MIDEATVSLYVENETKVPRGALPPAYRQDRAGYRPPDVNCGNGRQNRRPGRRPGGGRRFSYGTDDQRRALSPHGGAATAKFSVAARIRQLLNTAKQPGEIWVNPSQTVKRTVSYVQIYSLH